MSTSDELMAEFWPWYRDVDQDWVLDVFDLALGFYKGRCPDRAHHFGLQFANKARSRAEIEKPQEAS